MGHGRLLEMIDLAGFDRDDGVYSRCMITLRIANEIQEMLFDDEAAICSGTFSCFCLRRAGGFRQGSGPGAGLA
jgi:hypothetical protein